MKNKISKILMLLSIMSCHYEANYAEKTLMHQSEIITNLVKTNVQNKKILNVENIIKSLKVPVISYSYDTVSWNDNVNVNLIMLQFNTDKQFDFKIDHKLNLHTIYITLKKPISEETITLLTKKNKAKWTKEVNDFFKNKEIESVRAK